jgi:hypothetical protein
MAKTEVKTRDIGDGEVKRQDLNVSESGSAVTRRIIAGDGIAIVSTGVDSGTGDVTLRQKDRYEIKININGVANNEFFTVMDAGIPNEAAAFMFDKTYYLKKLFLGCDRNRGAGNLVQLRAFSVPDSDTGDISTADQNDWNARSDDAETTKFIAGGRNWIWEAVDESFQVVPNRRYAFFLGTGRSLRDVHVTLLLEEAVP